MKRVDFLVRKFLRPDNFRRSSRQTRIAFDFKEEFCRSGNFSLSGTIGIHWAIS
jgi:hypothetical protein